MLVSEFQNVLMVTLGIHITPFTMHCVVEGPLPAAVGVVRWGGTRDVPRCT
jgi:hypothetical protein